MMLNIMKSIQEKAPVIKKENRQDLREAEKKFHGPKTGVHGEHCVTERGEGGWKCTRCERFTTTHMGWKRLVRTKCLATRKTNRTKWRANSTAGNGCREQRVRRRREYSRLTTSPSNS
eukprot:3730096-Heterocapsa_arctica.AAC.1